MKDNELREEVPMNPRMRFAIDAPYKGDIYIPGRCGCLTVTEYDDICEGETLTARIVECPSAATVIGIAIVRPENSTVAHIEQQLRCIFESIDAFTGYCDRNGIEYKELPLWIDTHSFNEYTGEHRGDFAPFGGKRQQI